MPRYDSLSRHHPFVPKESADRLLTKIGSRVREERERLQLSKSELARRADIDRANLIAIEEGRRNLSVLLLAKLAKALQVKPSKLID